MSSQHSLDTQKGAQLAHKSKPQQVKEELKAAQSSFQDHSDSDNPTTKSKTTQRKHTSLKRDQSDILKSFAKSKPKPKLVRQDTESSAVASGTNSVSIINLNPTLEANILKAETSGLDGELPMLILSVASLVINLGRILTYL